MYKLNNREVEILEKEYQFGEGAYVVDAVFEDTGEHLSETELTELSDRYQMELYQEAYEDAASHAYDTYKDFNKYGE